MTLAVLAVSSAINVHSAELEASNGATGDGFGLSVSISGGIGLVGALHADVGINSDQGSAYIFRGLDTATGMVSENAKLSASDAAASDFFGSAVSVSGGIGLVAAVPPWDVNVEPKGAAYVFRGFDTATGTVIENVKLTASDGVTQDYFGSSVSISGNIGIIGAQADDIGGKPNQGSAYVFRNLDTATGTVTENAKLIASDGEFADFFGRSASVSGSIGLFGVPDDDIGSKTNQGSAYVFRNLDTVAGTITQNVKLIASNGTADDGFGFAVSLSGSMSLIGAPLISNMSVAYVFRNLDTATGTVTENVKLSPIGGSIRFGDSVSLSGSVGLVGTYHENVSSNSGAAYIFLGLDTATGTVNENVKLIASDGAASDEFGGSVSLDGDYFLIGDQYSAGLAPNSGKAYSGSISSVTVLDAGNTSRMIDGISFKSMDDWIVGGMTDSNQVTLTAGDSATIINTGKAVYIGKSADSDTNRLVIAGNLTANDLYIGSNAGNTGNTLQLEETAIFDLASFRLAAGNILSIEGDYSTPASLVAYLGTTKLEVWDTGLGLWTAVTTENAPNFITQSFSAGYTTIVSVPESSTWLLMIVAGALAFAMRQKGMQPRRH